MKMKKLVATALLLCSTAITVFAQSAAEEKYDRAMEDFPTRFGIKAGFNSANLTVDDAGTVQDKKAIASWHAGIYVDIPLLPIISIQPAILLNGKGAKFTVNDKASSNYTVVSTRPLYLEVPVNILLKVPLPNKVKLFAGAGLYAAFGIAGKRELEGKLLGVSFSDDDKIEYSNDNTGSNSSPYNGNLKRLDFGFNFIAGLEISHFTLNANYGYGIININPGSSNTNGKYQNRVFSISVGLII